MKNGNMPAAPTIGTINRVTQAFDETQVANNDFMLFGLTKREYTAIKMMAAMISEPSLKGNKKEFAVQAIECADTLLEELEKQN